MQHPATHDMIKEQFFIVTEDIYAWELQVHVSEDSSSHFGAANTTVQFYRIHWPPWYPLHFPLSWWASACFPCRLPHITGLVSWPFHIHPKHLVPLNGTHLGLFLFLSISNPSLVDWTDSFHSVPFLSHMLSTLDSTATVQLHYSTVLIFHFPFHLSRLFSLDSHSP